MERETGHGLPPSEHPPQQARSLEIRHCLADIAVLREQPELAGPVASDPVVSRLVSVLAGDLSRSLKAIRAARSAARERAWALAGENAPGADGPVIVDLDATIVIAHSSALDTGS